MLGLFWHRISSPLLRRVPFLLQPSQFILAWDRHQICCLAYPVASFLMKLNRLLKNRRTHSVLRRDHHSDWRRRWGRTRPSDVAGWWQTGSCQGSWHHQLRQHKLLNTLLQQRAPVLRTNWQGRMQQMLMGCSYKHVPGDHKVGEENSQSLPGFSIAIIILF